MVGAIVGDVIGSVFEFANVKRENFDLFCPESHFTDDTILTVAVAESILDATPWDESMRKWHHLYPEAGYGGSFITWANSDDGPYNSFGNGSAMRVSPVGWAFRDLDTVLAKARESAEVTHNHTEGIKGAQAVAAAIFLARTGSSKNDIRQFVEDYFHYNLSGTVEEIRRTYTFDVSCQGSVPQAIVAFLESRSFEDAIRKAVSLGGDSDTIACITGSIAHAFYGSVPKHILQEVFDRLDDRITQVVHRFCRQFNISI